MLGNAKNSLSCFNNGDFFVQGHVKKLYGICLCLPVYGRYGLSETTVSSETRVWRWMKLWIQLFGKFLVGQAEARALQVSICMT